MYNRIDENCTGKYTNIKFHTFVQCRYWHWNSIIGGAFGIEYQALSDISLSLCILKIYKHRCICVYISIQYYIYTLSLFTILSISIYLFSSPPLYRNLLYLQETRPKTGQLRSYPHHHPTHQNFDVVAAFGPGRRWPGKRP